MAHQTPGPTPSILYPRSTDLARSWPYLAALFMVALVAFWPSYLARPPGSSSGYTHLHALTAALWMLVLIAQPLAVRTGRMTLHRAVGRSTYVLAPLVVVSMVLLANARIRGADAGAYVVQSYVLYLQISLALLFAICYAMAILNRRNTPVHARFMICTALTLIDPVVVRLMFQVAPVPAWNYEWFTYGLTDAILLILIWLERREAAGRWVFPTMLVVFILAQTPALNGFAGDPGLAQPGAPAWQAFTRWFAALPLT